MPCEIKDEDGHLHVGRVGELSVRARDVVVVNSRSIPKKHQRKRKRGCFWNVFRKHKSRKKSIKYDEQKIPRRLQKRSSRCHVDEMQSSSTLQPTSSSETPLPPRMLEQTPCQVYQTPPPAHKAPHATQTTCCPKARPVPSTCCQQGPPSSQRQYGPSMPYGCSRPKMESTSTSTSVPTTIVTKAACDTARSCVRDMSIDTRETDSQLRQVCPGVESPQTYLVSRGYNQCGLQEQGCMVKNFVCPKPLPSLSQTSDSIIKDALKAARSSLDYASNALKRSLELKNEPSVDQKGITMNVPPRQVQNEMPAVANERKGERALNKVKCLCTSLGWRSAIPRNDPLTLAVENARRQAERIYLGDISTFSSSPKLQQLISTSGEPPIKSSKGIFEDKANPQRNLILGEPSNDDTLIDEKNTVINRKHMFPIQRLSPENVHQITPKRLNQTSNTPNLSHLYLPYKPSYDTDDSSNNKDVINLLSPRISARDDPLGHANVSLSQYSPYFTSDVPKNENRRENVRDSFVIQPRNSSPLAKEIQSKELEETFRKNSVSKNTPTINSNKLHSRFYRETDESEVRKKRSTAKTRLCSRKKSRESKIFPENVEYESSRKMHQVFPGKTSKPECMRFFLRSSSAVTNIATEQHAIETCSQIFTRTRSKSLLSSDHLKLGERIDHMKQKSSDSSLSEAQAPKPVASLKQVASIFQRGSSSSLSDKMSATSTQKFTTFCDTLEKAPTQNSMTTEQSLASRGRRSTLFFRQFSAMVDNLQSGTYLGGYLSQRTLNSLRESLPMYTNQHSNRKKIFSTPRRSEIMVSKILRNSSMTVVKHLKEIPMHKMFINDSQVGKNCAEDINLENLEERVIMVHMPTQEQLHSEIRPITTSEVNLQRRSTQDLSVKEINSQKQVYLERTDILENHMPMEQLASVRRLNYFDFREKRLQSMCYIDSSSEFNVTNKSKVQNNTIEEECGNKINWVSNENLYHSSTNVSLSINKKILNHPFEKASILRKGSKIRVLCGHENGQQENYSMTKSLGSSVKFFEEPSVIKAAKDHMYDEKVSGVEGWHIFRNVVQINNANVEISGAGCKSSNEKERQFENDRITEKNIPQPTSPDEIKTSSSDGSIIRKRPRRCHCIRNTLLQGLQNVVDELPTVENTEISQYNNQSKSRSPQNDRETHLPHPRVRKCLVITGNNSKTKDGDNFNCKLSKADESTHVLQQGDLLGDVVSNHNMEEIRSSKETISSKTTSEITDEHQKSFTVADLSSTSKLREMTDSKDNIIKEDGVEIRLTEYSKRIKRNPRCHCNLLENELPNVIEKIPNEEDTNKSKFYELLTEQNPQSSNGIRYTRSKTSKSLLNSQEISEKKENIFKSQQSHDLNEPQNVFSANDNPSRSVEELPNKSSEHMSKLPSILLTGDSPLSVQENVSTNNTEIYRTSETNNHQLTSFEETKNSDDTTRKIISNSRLHCCCRSKRLQNNRDKDQNQREQNSEILSEVVSNGNQSNVEETQNKPLVDTPQKTTLNSTDKLTLEDFEIQKTDDLLDECLNAVNSPRTQSHDSLQKVPPNILLEKGIITSSKPQCFPSKSSCHALRKNIMGDSLETPMRSQRKAYLDEPQTSSSQPEDVLLKSCCYPSGVCRNTREKYSDKCDKNVSTHVGNEVQEHKQKIVSTGIVTPTLRRCRKFHHIPVNQVLRESTKKAKKDEEINSQEFYPCQTCSRKKVERQSPSRFSIQTPESDKNTSKPEKFDSSKSSSTSRVIYPVRTNHSDTTIPLSKESLISNVAHDSLESRSMPTTVNLPSSHRSRICCCPNRSSENPAPGLSEAQDGSNFEQLSESKTEIFSSPQSPSQQSDAHPLFQYKSSPGDDLERELHSISSSQSSHHNPQEGRFEQDLSKTSIPRVDHEPSPSGTSDFQPIEADPFPDRPPITNVPVTTKSSREILCQCEVIHPSKTERIRKRITSRTRKVKGTIKSSDHGITIACTCGKRHSVGKLRCADKKKKKKKKKSPMTGDPMTGNPRQSSSQNIPQNTNLSTSVYQNRSETNLQIKTLNFNSVGQDMSVKNMRVRERLAATCRNNLGTKRISSSNEYTSTKNDQPLREGGNVTPSETKFIVFKRHEHCVKQDPIKITVKKGPKTHGYASDGSSVRTPTANSERKFAGTSNDVFCVSSCSSRQHPSRSLSRDARKSRCDSLGSDKCRTERNATSSTSSCFTSVQNHTLMAAVGTTATASPWTQSKFARRTPPLPETNNCNRTTTSQHRTPSLQGSSPYRRCVQETNVGHPTCNVLHSWNHNSTRTSTEDWMCAGRNSGCEEAVRLLLEMRRRNRECEAASRRSLLGINAPASAPPPPPPQRCFTAHCHCSPPQ